jgi:hypothetical protein
MIVIPLGRASVSALIAFSHLLYGDDGDSAVEVEKHPIVPNPEPIAVAMVFEGLHFSTVREVRELRIDRIPDADLYGLGKAGKLFESLRHP